MGRYPSDKIKAVFLAALERRESDQRAAYLDGACGEDAEMRLRVEELLQAMSSWAVFTTNDWTLAVSRQATSRLQKGRAPRSAAISCSKKSEKEASA